MGLIILPWDGQKIQLENIWECAVIYNVVLIIIIMVITFLFL